MNGRNSSEVGLRVRLFREGHRPTPSFTRETSAREAHLPPKVSRVKLFPPRPSRCRQSPQWRTDAARSRSSIQRPRATRPQLPQPKGYDCWREGRELNRVRARR
jgi:hypothetical protein